MANPGKNRPSKAPRGVFQAVNGTYAFDGRDRVTCAAADGATIWVRAE